MPKDQFITIPSTLFIFVFSFLLLLLAFLTETNYNLFIFLLLVVFYLIISFYFHLKKRLIITHKEACVILVGAISIIALLALNTASVSIPLSTLRWLQIAIGILTFSIFFPKKLLGQNLVEMVLFCSLLPSIVLFGWNLYFLVFSDLVTNVPSKTLLTAVYGHNHVYIYYIYVLVISYYFMHLYQKNILLKVIALVSFIGICLSFSRIGMFILFLVIGYRILRQKKSSYALPLLAGVSFLYISAAVFLSFNTKMSSLDQCTFPFFRTQLCKSIAHEARDDYIRQAVTAIQAKPILGNGGGTFGIASLQYRDNVHGYSSMTHNEYLQLIYEYGLLGLGAVVIYFWALFVATFRVKHASLLGKHLWAIIVLFTLDGFLNFNWNLSFIFILQCMVLALLYRELFNDSTHKHKYKSYNILYLASILLIATPVIFLTGRYAYAELFLKDQPIEYTKVFPYSEYQVKAALQSPAILEKDTSRLLDLYQKNTEIYLLAAAKLNIDTVSQYEYVLSIDPYDEARRIKLLLAAAKQGKSDIVLRESELLYTVYLRDNPARISRIEPEYLETLLAYANHLTLTDIETAFQVTLAAYAFEPWRINEVHTVFLQNPEDFPVQYIEALITLPNVDILWGYQKSMSGWYVQQVNEAAKLNKQQRVTHFSKKAIELDTNNLWALWDAASAVYRSNIERTYYEPSVTSYETRRMNARSWLNYLEFLHSIHPLDPDEYQSWRAIVLGYGSP